MGWALSPKSRDSLFLAGLSHSTPGKAMHKNSCSAHATEKQEKNPIIWIKYALLKKNLKYDQKKRQFRSKAFKPHKTLDTTVLPSNFSSTGRKPSLLSLICKSNIAFTQFCPTQSPAFTNKTAEHLSGINILHFTGGQMIVWKRDPLHAIGCRKRRLQALLSSTL